MDDPNIPNANAKAFESKHLTLKQLGWQTAFQDQLANDNLDDALIARVSAHHGSQISFLTVESEIQAPTSIIEPAAQTESTSQKVQSNIAVGDWFLLDRNDHRAIRLLERKTMLHRKAAGETVKPQLIAANIDSVFIVSSCNQEFNLSRLERYLTLVLESQAIPIVVLTKADLHEAPAELRKQVEKLHSGLLVETVDARDPSQTSVLEYWCGEGKTIALLGSSGVGKSTLANALGGHQILTQGIREDDARGRHTTTTRSLHRLKGGGWLIDTPGMRELQLPACEQGISDLFEDIVNWMSQCRFSNCGHHGDQGCAIEAALESGELDLRRWTNFQKLKSEQARNSTSLAERRERERKTGQMYKRVIAEKKNRRS